MENSSFNTVIVRDSRIQDISSKLDVVVQKGPASNTFQHIPATSQTVSSVNFNVVVPSENNIIDREVTWTSTPTIKIEIAANTVEKDAVCFDYGTTEALNQFPLNSLLTNANVTINSQSISVSSQDILHTLIRTTDDDKLSKYNCPHMSDKRFKSYADMILSESNPLTSFTGAREGSIPRGAHPAVITVERYVSGTLTRRATSNVDTAANYLDALTSSAMATNSWIIYVTFTSTEPLMFMSPFIYGDNINNSAGLYGVNNMSFTFSIDSSAKRAFCSSSGIPMNVSLSGLIKNEINLNYLTCQPSDLLASKNVVPLCEYSRYLTIGGGSLASNASSTLSTLSLQLSQIPNRIFVVVRKQLSSQSVKDSNTFFAINSVNVDFNNVAGILSGANAEDLYRMSKRNGSRQDLYEFLGKANVGRGLTKATAGSILVINPAKDLQCPDYLSNGSTGQFNFQFNLNVTNNEAGAVVPEIMVITENDGLFITQAGQSFKQTSLLTKELVMNSTMGQFGESDKYVSSFGEGNGSNLCASSIKNIPFLNQKKSSGTAPAESGGAFSGGARSGGAYSGGAYF
jgi:hypothetical protein